MRFLRYLCSFNRVLSSQSAIINTTLKSVGCHQNVCSINRNFCIDNRSESFGRNVNKGFSNLSEEEYLRQQNNPDEFGPPTTSEYDESLEDEGDEREEKFLSESSERLRTKQYADLIKKHFKNKRVKEAIDVVEIKMIKEDKVPPQNYIYNLLIGGCARAGYTKKAFMLYNRMKQRDLKVTGGTYTSLFNACANSPYINDGLKRANHLREIMLEKNFEPNLQNYNAMIKAYGRCGDLMTAFQLVDEMVQKKLPVKLDTLNFLLQACISDKQFGFRHALLVWHKMLRWRFQPDIYSFNLLLRTVRDCGIGDVETTEEVIQKIVSKSNQKLLQSPDENPKKLILNPNDSTSIEETSTEDSLQILNDNELPDDSLPNLISRQPHLGQLVGLKEIEKPEDRLLLIGGMKGVLAEMKINNVHPDIKTFTELLDVIPPTLAAEKYLLSSIRKLNVRVDIDFLNMLIKKRSMRFDYESAKDVLKMIKSAKLTPDIVTYGVLALGCKSQAEAEDLLERMYQANVRMNIEILGAMLRQGCTHFNFPYINFILDLCITEELWPNEHFLIHLHSFYKKCSYMRKTESELIKNIENFHKELFNFSKKMEKFNAKYDLVDRNLEESLKRIKVNPYDQFKTSQPGGFQRELNEKKRFYKKPIRQLKESEI